MNIKKEDQESLEENVNISKQITDLPNIPATVLAHFDLSSLWPWMLSIQVVQPPQNSWISQNHWQLRQEKKKEEISVVMWYANIKLLI